MVRFCDNVGGPRGARRSFMPVAARAIRRCTTLDVKAFKAFDPGAPVFYQIQKTDTTKR